MAAGARLEEEEAGEGHHPVAEAVVGEWGICRTYFQAVVEVVEAEVEGAGVAGGRVGELHRGHRLPPLLPV